VNNVIIKKTFYIIKLSKFTIKPNKELLVASSLVYFKSSDYFLFRYGMQTINLHDLTIIESLHTVYEELYASTLRELRVGST
jgi:hypothetical protein